MLAKKKDVNKILTFFLFSHLIIWTLAPGLSNNNLPLDTIEALAWGSNLEWGFNKHPPLSALAVEIFYRIFGNNDWVYYFLSQIFVVSTFFIIFEFSKYFLKNPIHRLISVFLLEGIYFYNFTTPEFNVNVCQLPFWALSVLYCWKGLKDNKIIDWLLFGLFAALGILSKYLFIYLLVAIDIFFIYLLINKKINYKCLVSLLTFFIILIPHIIWLSNNDYITFTYALHRTGTEEFDFFKNHLLNPLTFLGKQIGILIPFFVMFLFIISKFKFKFKLNFKDKKLLYLLAVNFLPLILMFFTSMFMGAKIRTMWMTPFYIFSGVLFIYIFESKVKMIKLKYFISTFLIIFIFSPIAYYYISITKTDKRTDYSGKEIAYQVQKKFDEDFIGKIVWVVGDEWHGGNLSYHLASRPKWHYILSDKNFDSKHLSSVGVVTTIGIASDEISKKFSNLCESKKMNGKFHTIERISFCINGVEKK